MPRRKRNAEAEQPPIDGGEDATVELSNSALRADVIRDAARYLAEREAEIAMVREEINAYKQKHIKGDLGFKLSDWNTVYRLYQLESEDRDKLLDTLREGFAALGIGEQSSFLDAMDRMTPAAPPPPSGNGQGNGHVDEMARAAGRADGFAGAREHEADWPNGQLGAASYERGYDEGVAQRERAATAF